MIARLTPVLLWWEARVPRERLLLSVLFVVLGVWLLVAGVWQPLHSSRVRLSDQIARHERALAVVQSLPMVTTAVTTQDSLPLANVVTETAAAFQLTIRRLEPEGSRVRLVLDEVPFDAVILWIEAVERDHGLRVTELQLTRRPAPGVVNSVLALERR